MESVSRNKNFKVGHIVTYDPVNVYNKYTLDLSNSTGYIDRITKNQYGARIRVAWQHDNTVRVHQAYELINLGEVKEIEDDGDY